MKLGLCMCVVVAATLVAFASPGQTALSAAAAKAPTAAQRVQINAAVRTWWCTFLPKSSRPCSKWTLTVDKVKVSTVLPAWGLVHMLDVGHGVSSNILPGGMNMFVRDDHGKWKVFRWFVGLRALTCNRAAAEIGVPERALDDLGICAQLVELP